MGEQLGVMGRPPKAGRASFSDFTIMKTIDRASPVFFRSKPAGDGATFTSLQGNGGVSLDLGTSASVDIGISFTDGNENPTESISYRIVGPIKLINRPPPPTNSLRLAHSPFGVGVDCSADFSDLGAMSVTAQFLSNGGVLAQASGLPAFLAMPICTLDKWPDRLAWSSTDGAFTLRDLLHREADPLGGFVLQSNPTGTGLSCAGCVGDTLRIIPELPPGLFPPAYASELQAVASEGMSSTVFDLQTTSGCPPALFNLTPTSSGLTLDWSAAGYRLQGAETPAGPWYELGSASPVTVPASAQLRLFRLVCQ